MKSFVNVEQPYIAPSIEAFGQAMDNLQQRHDAAVEALSEAQTNIANLDFNTVDKDVQAEMLQKVKDLEITFENSPLGTYNINDVLKTTAHVMSDPKYTQALKNQQIFKELTQNIRNREDLTEGEKEWAVKKIEYNFETKKDVNGNLVKDENGIVTRGINNMGIGNVKENENYQYYKDWSSDWVPVTQIDNTKLYDEMIKLAMADTTSTTTSEFEQILNNLTGNLSTNVVSTESNATTQLTEEKLQKALSAAIENYPGAKESLRQEYQYELDEGYTTEDNFDNWLKNKFIKGVQAHSYLNEATSETIKANSTKLGAGAGGGQRNSLLEVPDFSTTAGQIVVAEEDVNPQTKLKNTSDRLNMYEILVRDKLNVNPEDASSLEEIITKAVEDKKLTKDEASDILLDKYTLERELNSYQTTINDIEENFTDQQKEDSKYFEMTENYEYDYYDNEGNKQNLKWAKEQLNPYKNYVGPDGNILFGQTVFREFGNTTRERNNYITYEFDRFFDITNNGNTQYDNQRVVEVGRNKYKQIKQNIIDDGLENLIICDDDNYSFIVPKNKEAFLNFAVYYENAMGYFTAFNNTADKFKTDVSLTNIPYINQQPDLSLKNVAKAYKTVKERNDNDYNIHYDPYTVNVQNLTVNSIDREGYIIDYSNGELKYTDLNATLKNIADDDKRSLKTASFNDIAGGGLYLKGENGVYEKLNSADSIEYERLVKSVLENNNFGMSFASPAGHNSGYTMSFHGKIGNKDVDFELFLENVHKNNKSIQKYDNLSSTRARKKLEQIKGRNNPIIGNNLSEELNLDTFRYYYGTNANGDEIRELVLNYNDLTNKGLNNITIPINSNIVEDDDRMYIFTTQLYDLIDYIKYIKRAGNNEDFANILTIPEELNDSNNYGYFTVDSLLQNLNLTGQDYNKVVNAFKSSITQYYLSL